MTTAHQANPAESSPQSESLSKPVIPTVRVVSSRRIKLNYQVEDVGPSGVSGVDLWFTQDSRTWTKPEAPAQQKGPYFIEVSEEGLYGFTLVAHNGIGGGKEPPHAGDLPQIWVLVDQTKPAVHITSAKVTVTGDGPRLQVAWKASDKNLGQRPITLYYAEKADGPWLPVAANLENKGTFAGKLPPGAPNRFLVRVAAIDLAGNIGTDQTAEPVLVDRSQPRVSILDID
jgi:hypothetical protein